MTSDVNDGLGGIDTTLPTLGKLALFVVVAMSISTCSCFTMSWFWTTVLLEVPMYIYNSKKINKKNWKCRRGTIPISAGTVPTLGRTHQ